MAQNLYYALHRRIFILISLHTDAFCVNIQDKDLSKHIGRCADENLRGEILPAWEASADKMCAGNARNKNACASRQVGDAEYRHNDNHLHTRHTWSDQSRLPHHVPILEKGKA